MNPSSLSADDFCHRTLSALAAFTIGLSSFAAVVAFQVSTPGVAGATGSPIPTISNIPSSATPGGSFTPAVLTSSSGATSVTSTTPSICSVNQDGSVSYLAAGTCSLTSHVAATQANFGFGLNHPFGVAVDALGNVYVADTGNSRVEKVSPTGTQTTIGPGFSNPFGVAVDTLGNVYVTGYAYNHVEKVNPTGTQTTVGSGFFRPQGVAVDTLGNVYVADYAYGEVAKVALDGTQTTIGSGFGQPCGVAVDPLGNVYVADTGNNRVEKVSLTGTQTTIGSGFSGPLGVAVDPLGNVYVADTGNNRVEKVSPTGTQTTIGSGWSAPSGVAVDPLGNVYVAEYANYRVVEVTPAVDGAAQSFTINPPATPTGISAVAGNQSALVSWTNPASNGDPATHNEVQYSTDRSTWTTASATLSPSATTYTVTGLTNGTGYYFRVIALDGTGNPSAPDTMGVTVTPTVPPPPVHKPGAPTRVSAVTHGSSVRITWHAPRSNGGARITRYKVLLAPGGKTCTTAKLSCSVSGLKIKSYYTISITATNSAGTGPATTLRHVKG